jgi:prepilin-type N-terminal cleavage/methylation domain-containing protein
MQKKLIKKGFSIPEVIVAIAMIVLIIVSATNLLISSIRANSTNINRLIAYNLAQEALEGIRNIRDGYWLNNQYWRGDEKSAGLFGDHFFEDGFYIIEKDHNFFNPKNCKVKNNNLNTLEVVSQYSPWHLTKVNAGVDNIQNNDNVQLYKSQNNNNGNLFYYTHEKSNEFSGFKRWLEIQTIPFEDSNGNSRDDLKIAVTAVVEWEERGRTKDLRLSTILTDWKAGPL